MPLPTNRTTANTAAEHVADHNTLHAEYNTPTHTHSGTYAARYGVRVRQSSGQSIANGAYTAMTWDTEDWDDDTMHDTATNTSRIIAKTAGTYLVFAMVGFVFNATGIRQFGLSLNGSATPTSGMATQPGFAARGMMAISTVHTLALNDYLEILTYQDSGGALAIDVTGGNPHFGMVRIA